MNYSKKYLKYKLKYYRLVEQIGGNKQIIKEVKTCISTATNDQNTKECIEKYGKKFIVAKINSNNHLKCHIVKGIEHYHIVNKDTATSGVCEIQPASTDPEFNWSNYKEYFGDDKKSIIYAFRTELVNELIQFIFDNYPPCTDSICKFVPSGSTGPDATLNSDYDLTLSGNYKISVIIQMFNSIFEHEFGKTSSEIFDTNLYGYSFLINKAAVGKNKLWSPILKSKLDGLQGLIISQNKSIKQDKWAYLRLKTFYENEQNTDLREILQKVTHNLYDDFYEKNNINEMKAKGPNGKQSNYLIQMKLFENQMENQMEKTDLSTKSNKNKDKMKMINTLSNMNYFGDETYFTQGAFIHVVGLMYLKTETDENKQELFSKKYYLLHSMVENFAYFIHTFYGHNNNIIYAIKYFDRFINALYWLEKNNKILELNNFTEWIKLKIRNRSEEEVLGYLENHKSTLLEHGLSEVSKCEGSDLAEVTVMIKNKLKENIAKFVKLYTTVEIAQKQSCKFYLIALLEILKTTIEKYKDFTHLVITKSDTGKFSFTVRSL